MTPRLTRPKLICLTLFSAACLSAGTVPVDTARREGLPRKVVVG